MTPEQKKIETAGAALLSESKRDAFYLGAISPEAKNYWQKGMYTEEEVLALFENWLNTKINEELMVISGELDCLEGVTFSDWFERNKKK